MKKLQNKVVIITGAGSGMGEAISKLFSEEGAKIVAVDVNVVSLDKLTNEITQKGGVAMKINANVANEDEVSSVIKLAMDTFGTIDILVNNAGIMDDFYPVDLVTNDLWHKVMGINLDGPFFACRLVVPIMLKQGSGVIINISSVGGLNGSRAGAPYTASKHALIGLTKNIGFMYAKSGIRCNAIAPGGVNTNIGKSMKPNAFGYERCTSGGVNMPRMGDALEIANTALFLASNDSSFINGSVLVADGGWTAY
jgi:NAD(P)-dependent dehydrogenase (short-subunit alcohol dehydrogenase family)